MASQEYQGLDLEQGDFRRATARESQILQGLKEGKSSEEIYRLTAAACALIHCANGVPEYDPNYALLQQLQKDGESFTEEQKTIRQESSRIALNEITDENGNIYDDAMIAQYFSHTPGDSAAELITRHDEGVTRIEGLASTASGGVGILAGYAMASGGVATCGLTVGLSCASIPVGVGIAALSGNHMSNGYQTFIGDYAGSNEGAIVLNSLQPHTGDLPNPLGGFAFNMGANALGIVGGASALNSIWGAESASIAKAVEALAKTERTFATTDAVAISGVRAIDKGISYENAVRNIYGVEKSYAERQYLTTVEGTTVRGVADNIYEGAAVEAKYVDNWATSLRNPNSPVGSKPWAVAEQNNMANQAQKYSSSADFSNIIYHTNSVEFATHYTNIFNNIGIKNFEFIITPVK
jgi:hypothetical protein